MPHHPLSIIPISSQIIIILAITFNLLILPNNVTCSITNNPQLVHHECTRDSSNSYTSGSLFETNLNTTLLRSLSADDALSGFSKNTTGNGSDRVYSVFYCQGDIRGEDCRDCFEAAGRVILQRCHLLKEGIIWYQECTLHYSSRKSVVFSTEEVSTSPSHRSYNFSSVLQKNLDQKEETFEKLMNGLIEKAAADGNNGNDNDNINEGMLQGYATGETALSEKMTLGGVVQCRPDLVSRACQTCLRSALKQMDGWSTTMVFLPSCNLRFHLYPSHSHGPSTSSGRGGESIPRKVLIPMVVAVSVVLLCSIVCLVIFCRKKRQRRNKPPSNGEAHQAADGEPSNVENYNATDPPSIHARGFDYESVISTASYTTVEIPHWNAQNLTRSPEPSAPPLPEGHVNQQRH